MDTQLLNMLAVSVAAAVLSKGIAVKDEHP